MGGHRFTTSWRRMMLMTRNQAEIVFNQATIPCWRDCVEVEKSWWAAGGHTPNNPHDSRWRSARHALCRLLSLKPWEVNPADVSIEEGIPWWVDRAHIEHWRRALQVRQALE